MIRKVLRFLAAELYKAAADPKLAPVLPDVMGDVDRDMVGMLIRATPDEMRATVAKSIAKRAGVPEATVDQIDEVVRIYDFTRGAVRLFR